MNEELDSQLSAMFDDELPEDQCQLLARRLSRDDALKARWRRYAVMGAAIRAERGVRLETNLAARVSSVISAEPALAGEAVAKGEKTKGLGIRWWQPLVGGAIAAGVAAMSVLWIRAESPVGAGTLVAQNPAPSTTISAAVNPAPAAVAADNSAPETYVVPAAVERTRIVPTAELANYVVAHSEFSAPVSRRNLLSALVASEMAGEMGSEVGTAAANEESDDAEEVVAIPASNTVPNALKKQNAR
jgi:negative regulator of sigma E activity